MIVLKKDIYWSCNCGFRENAWLSYYWKCPVCGKPLNLDYEKRFEPVGGRGLARYSNMLPFSPIKTRGEGSTPLVFYEDGINKILFKLEYLNPSGSFKDRGSSLALTYAYSLGYKSVVEDTSGNTGVSVALYSKLYGMKCSIYMPKTAPRGKKILIKALGGSVIETENREEAALKVAESLNNSFYVAHTWNPIYILGASTIVYEIYEEFGVPDVVLTPIGSGGLFLGLHMGFRNLSLIENNIRIPYFIAIQGCSVQPVYEMIYGYRACGESWLADGIMVVKPPRLDEIVNVISTNRFRVELVNNDDVLNALRELHEMGFIVEPTSATVWAVYRRIRGDLRNKTILIPLTGSGLKTLDVWEAASRSPT